MKISLEWLKEFVDLREKPQKIKDDLTMLGLVVESFSETSGDTVFELEITSNRPDCLSHVGVARELAALYRRALKFPPSLRVSGAPKNPVPFEIRILDKIRCPRYTGLIVDGVKVAPSPEWVRRRLELAGMRPLNNIVDITNYVLLETGHPIHAFDFRFVRNGRIRVARARGDQKMHTLDGIERLLDDPILLINDGVGPIAIAGVMGGADSEIREDTDTVLIECAYFQPASIRRTSKKLGLSTEASYRFERGANWDDTAAVTLRCAYLMQELAGGRVASKIQDVYPIRFKPRKIKLARSRAESLLGVSLENRFIVDTLKRLEFKPVSRGAGAWDVVCPPHRADMELEVDLIEEIARFFGYENIPTTVPPARAAGVPSPDSGMERSTRDILCGLGYSEAVNLSFALEADETTFSTARGERVGIRNPLTQDTQYLRTSLVPGLARSVRRNFNHGNLTVRLFEIGRIFSMDGNGKIVEKSSLGIIGTGGYAESNWHHPPEEFDYFHIKGALQTLFIGLRLPPLKIRPAEGPRWLNPASASEVELEQSTIGILGSVHPDLEEQFKFRQDLFVAELDFDALARHALKTVEYASMPRFPVSERDLSVVVSREASYAAIREGILQLAVPELIGVELIDVYEGGVIPPEKVSLTLRFTFQDASRTLTIDQVQAFSDNILNCLRSSFGAELR